jgi:hypothetical protein
VKLTGGGQRLSETSVRFGIVRLETNDLAEMPHRFRVPALTAEKAADLLVEQGCVL